MKKEGNPPQRAFHGTPGQVGRQQATAKGKSLEPQRAQRSQRKIYENRKRWAGKRITSGSIMQRAECIFGQKNFVMFAAIPLEPASLLAKSLYGSSSGWKIQRLDSTAKDPPWRACSTKEIRRKTGT